MILGIEVSKIDFNRLIKEQEQGNQLTAINGKIEVKEKSEKEKSLIDIDTQLDELASDLLHNETYANDSDYQATKEDILIKMQNLRDDRRFINAK